MFLRIHFLRLPEPRTTATLIIIFYSECEFSFLTYFFKNQCQGLTSHRMLIEPFFPSVSMSLLLLCSKIYFNSLESSSFVFVHIDTKYIYFNHKHAEVKLAFVKRKRNRKFFIFNAQFFSSSRGASSIFLITPFHFCFLLFLCCFQ